MLAAVSSMWKLMQMAQVDVIRFALDGENWVSQEYLHMLTYVLDTEISPQINIVKISINFLEGLIDGEKPWEKQIPRC